MSIAEKLFLSPGASSAQPGRWCLPSLYSIGSTAWSHNGRLGGCIPARQSQHAYPSTPVVWAALGPGLSLLLKLKL
ncbi:hypothetical protein GGTG_00912 [Gaeumannomyces tritici R3-111a-1]|uniref:Uncharacterized protein n=1 Tax=Gaeumannomyces tritici (strain R3-111a-1) TaxID=644352 RepID=J3NI28_GAET3|nr:hypothetical protein GGTG_00912 [Gaeumannomyces tritici R3-111a-1]EJT80921.1 hypothetical protein GGTG_00912 [Gaeumannomyces tritici R3-111a-1]